MIDDAHRVAQAFGLFHVVGGIDNAGTVRPLGFDQFEQTLAGLRVNANRGFIQQHDRRSVHDAAAKIQSALHAAGEGFGQVFGPVTQSNRAEHFLDPRFQCAASQSIGLTPVPQVIDGGQVFVQREFLWHDSKRFLGIARVFLNVKTVHADMARGGLQQA